MMLKSQSAVEFITVYGFVFLILGVMLSVLFVLASTPVLSSTQSCAVYGGFTCSDAALSQNSITGNASLYLLLINGQPGIVNISSFNATISNVHSVSGSCYPSRSSQGNTVTCAADIPIQAKIGKKYTGYFSIASNYCAPPLSQQATFSCPSNKNVTFNGQVSMQG